ncbi:hypothetical protein JXB41_04580 [Candidatus Woesearchaeota archaeon]|nr:hypothetical protein [Candidatus Woesearchaeota archaeon]
MRKGIVFSGILVLMFILYLFLAKALSVTLVSPGNNTWTNGTNNTIGFEFYYTGNASDMSCGLFFDDTGHGKNDTALNNTVTSLHANNTLSEGHHSWLVNCSNLSVSAVSSSYNITIDRTAPYLVLVSPPEGSLINISSIDFVFNVSDNLDVNISCVLYVNNYTSLGEQYNETVFVNNNSLGNITLSNFSNGNYSWLVNCTDNASNYNLSSERNFEVNSEPFVKSVSVNPSVTLSPGSVKEIQCNTTVSDPYSYTEIGTVTVVLYYEDNDFDDEDDNKTHYTGSCIETGSGGNDISYTCNFSLQYFTTAGLWYCNVSVTDNYGFTGISHNITNIEELYAVNITPQVIDYGSLAPGDNSSSDEIITVQNLGNKEIDVTLFGYGLYQNDGLAMDCTLGNITISYEKYSLSSGLSYNLMDSLTNEPFQLDDFNLASANNTYNAEKNIYWKIGVPKPRKGNCSGYVVVGGVAS